MEQSTSHMQLYAEAFTATTHVVAAAAPASPTTQPCQKAPDLARRRQRLGYAAQVCSGKTGGLPAWAMARAAGVARRVELARPGAAAGAAGRGASMAAGLLSRAGRRVNEPSPSAAISFRPYFHRQTALPKKRKHTLTT